MRRADDMPMDPEIAAELEVIDATLAGDPVASEYAELAELALLVADERPRPDARFVARLDDRAAARFAAGRERRAADGDGPVTAATPWWRRALIPSVGAVGALAAAAVAVVLVPGSGPSHHGGGVATMSAAGSAASAPSVRSPAASAATAAAQPNSVSVSGATATVQPVPNGRKIVQSAQLSLTTASAHVDDVAQEVFNAVGLAGGIVNSSSVTAASGADGYAQFQLSVPSASLGQTMAALSRLRYASVASRTDTTQDVNDSYQSTVRALADARALRTALLRQLAAATTTQQIAAIKAQIRDAEASIASDEATLRSLNQRISYSHVSVSINTAAAPPVPVTTSHGFTIGRAWHDAGRVLAVAAGVGIITLAVLLPVALIVALGLWIAALVRRHRREQALDLA